MYKKYFLILVFLLILVPIEVFAYTKNVLVIKIDPYLTTKKMYASDFAGINNTQLIIDNLKSDIAYGSNNTVSVNIVGVETLNEFPTYTTSITLNNGKTSYRLDESTFISMFKDGYYGWWERVPAGIKKLDEGFYFDYDYFIKKFDLVNRRNNNEFDEVWIISLDPLSAWETAMVGKTAYWVNGEAIEKNCKNFIIAGFTYGRYDTPLECLGHASEQILNAVFKSNMRYEENYLSITSNNYNTLNLWEKFTLVDYFNAKKSTQLTGPGVMHFAPNSEYSYDWLNSKSVYSLALDWKNYPNFTGKKALVNYKTWNPNGNEEYAGRHFHRWWFSLMPHISGRTKDGYSNNWWEYLTTLDYVEKVTPVSTSYTYTVGSKINARFKLTYQSNATKTYSVVGNENNVSIGTSGVIGMYDGTLRALKTGTTSLKLCYDGICNTTKITVKAAVNVTSSKYEIDNLSNKMYVGSDSNDVILKNISIPSGYTASISGNILQIKSGTTIVRNITLVFLRFESSLSIKNKQIKNVALNTTVNSLRPKIITNATVTFKNSSDKEITQTQLLGTGSKVYITTNFSTDSYSLIVKGDINGDGTATVSDVAKLYQYLKKKIDMNSYYIEAGNVVTTDSEIKVNDVAKLYQFIKGKIKNL